MKNVTVESTADAYLELLAARGIDYLFGNGGTDFGPIVDAYAKRLTLEQPVPTPITVPHEITALAMAHGYTMITGRTQSVMVHTVAGTANATGGLINASRNGVPILFSAGRTPITEAGLKGSRNGGIHWAQESFDQGSMVREWVKWDYELRPGADLEGVVDRALAISQTEPQGPVYLTLPREILAEERESFTYSERPRMTPNLSAPAPAAVRAAARALARARNPIAVTSALGRDPESVAEFVSLAETLGIKVYSPAHAPYMNFPVTHPLHQGATAAGELATADVVLVVESDVPWSPSAGQAPREDATVIAIGQDPLFQRYPIRGFRSEISLAGSTRIALSQLREALAAESIDSTAVEVRATEAASAHDRLRDGIRATATAGAGNRPLSKAWVSYCVNQVRTDDTIIVNELGLDATQMECERAGTLFGLTTAGVLGWGLGAALGAKLAARDKTVICAVGDGSYTFGVPTAAHWLSQKLDLPILYIVWNNAVWNAVASSTRTVYPDGWSARNDLYPFTDLSPSIEFELVCQASGGYGERVEDPADVPFALERALHAVRVEKRQALLNFVGEA